MRFFAPLPGTEPASLAELGFHRRDERSGSRNARSERPAGKARLEKPGGCPVLED
jgi:hypothetical protein